MEVLVHLAPATHYIMSDRSARQKMDLDPKRMMAIDFYMEGASKADAMRMSGYTERCATTDAKQVFAHPLVIKEIDRRQAKLMKKYELSEDWVIQRLMRIANSGEILAKFMVKRSDGLLDWDFSDATQDDLAAINELTVGYDKEGNRTIKIGSNSAKGALDSLCRKLGLFQDVNINIAEVTLVDRISAGRERSRQKTIDEEGKVVDNG